MKKIDSLYIHFPFCAHLCNYCDFFKRVPTDQLSDFKKYATYLEDSYVKHQIMTEKFGYSFSPLETLYIGGGTPSLWGSDGARYLQNFLKERNILLRSDCEFTLEVNPKTFSSDSIKSFMDIGVNRFSLGVQALDKKMITYLDRVHSIEDVIETLTFFSKLNVNFSMDFMLGLPFSVENNRDVIKELKESLNYGPKHFSVYILTVKDNYIHFKNLPTEEYIEDEYLKVAKFLKENKYSHYEVSNFAIEGYESKHNLNYWQEKTVAALGPSATGFLSEEKYRYKWKVNSIEVEIENLTDEEFKLEKLYMNLRSQIGIDLSLYINDENKRKTLLNKWKEKGYIYEADPRLILNSKGFLMLDSIIRDIM